MLETLVCDSLAVTYPNGSQAVRGVSFSVRAGECLALVGESGCGKTTIARTILGLLPAQTIVTGSVRVEGQEILHADPESLRKLRGLTIGYVSQDPFVACNPLARIIHHVGEAWYAHQQTPPPGQIVQRLEELGIQKAAKQARRYPHQWSGGMLQRATIAAAAAHTPRLIIADEPTSALDADRADSILSLLRQMGAALLLVSHDIGVVARHADSIAVCYAGEIVEIGPTASILNAPVHPYTVGLLEALPSRRGQLPVPLPGTPPDLCQPPAGCAFAPRCRHTQPTCHTHSPKLVGGVACPVVAPNGRQPIPLVLPHQKAWESRPPESTDRRYSDQIVVRLDNVSKIYGKRGERIIAVKNAQLSVRKGEIVGIRGPSGCGKSTLLRLLATIEMPDQGAVWLGAALAAQGGKRRLLSPLGRQGYVMPIFQDPLSSLDRRWPIWRSITEPLTAPHREGRSLTSAQRRELARQQLHHVNMEHIDLEARPNELSIGQCQRVAIVRALITKPTLIVADEPKSALDASVSTSILHLLAGATQDGTALVIVSHDQAVLEALCHRVFSMRDGLLEGASS